MATIADIAKKANVSVSTVSYAINGTRPISEVTRQRIFAVMEELGYRPNAMARGLASKKSRIIAVLFPDFGFGLGVTALGFFFNTAEAARQKGYNLVLWPTVIHARELREHIQQGLVDGVIVMEVGLHDERVKFLRQAKFPFSMIGRTENTDGLSYVDFDIDHNIQEAVNYLVDLGHTHIAFINTEKEVKEQPGPSVRSEHAFQKAVQAAGVRGVTRAAKCAPNAGYEAFEALIAEDPQLTALLTINDYSVPGIVQAIGSRGWNIPNDFSLIVGPTSPQMAEIMSPPLTSIDIPIAEMSQIGVKILLQQLEEHDAQLTQMLIPCRLTVRGSTGPCRQRS